MRKLTSHSIVYFIIVVLGLSCSSNSQQAVEFENVGVASAHPLATQAGLDVLAKGGNAFDAAIAIASSLNVVEPMMSGIGGYGTILIYDAKGERIRFLNPSGRFPVKTNTDLMRSPTPNYMENRVGPKSISTPGNLNAWDDMHKQYGSLHWSELFDHAIDYAENGFHLTQNGAFFIEYSFEDFPESARAFYGKDDKPLRKGDLLVQTDLANTFKIIAEHGVDPFYNGDIAEEIDRKMKDVGSFLGIEDLQNNKAEWWEPMKINFRGYDVFTASLPANSFAAFVNLGLMQQVPERSLEHNSVTYLHLFAEMTKESYKARLAYSFDPEVREAPLDSILNDDFLSNMLDGFDRNEASEFKTPFENESKNTTHFVVIDKWGNIVSATQTLGNLFGSRVMVEGTGIWLNNSMAYSTFEPKGNPMDAFPGRHKLSGDCPVIIMKDGKPWAALGTPGGHTITQNVPQIVINLIEFGMTMQEAINAPKIVFVEPNGIRVDHDMPASSIRELEKMGHQIKKNNIGNATGIRIIRDSNGEIISFETGIDYRGEGRAPIIDR